MSFPSSNICEVITQTTRIITAYASHFSALSVFFLLPISIATLIIYPLCSLSKSQLMVQILYSIFVLIFSLCAAASITYSTFHGFYGKPLKFLSSLKSIVTSFFPLLATLLLVHIILGLIVFLFVGLTLLAYNVLLSFGLEMDYDSDYFLIFISLFAVLLSTVLICLQAEWFLSTVIVVVESRWGFDPLRRSSFLVKGMRAVVFTMIVLIGILAVILYLWYSNFTTNAGEVSSWWIIFQMIGFAVVLTVCSLYTVTTNTVLFILCKASHEKSVLEITDEEFGFGGDYLRLPVDEAEAEATSGVM